MARLEVLLLLVRMMVVLVTVAALSPRCLVASIVLLIHLGRAGRRPLLLPGAVRILLLLVLLRSSRMIGLPEYSS